VLNTAWIFQMNGLTQKGQIVQALVAVGNALCLHLEIQVKYLVITVQDATIMFIRVNADYRLL